jgi:hypothetical protein
MSARPFDLLAEFLTGVEVAHQSIALGLPYNGIQRLRERAEQYFALRAAFGVGGYADKDEAFAAITKAIRERIAYLTSNKA